ncbi:MULTISPECIES: MurR/RpiR family transcriptional regulator [Brevibacillus]|jgi:Transcriptional regulators|uniref:RpiR family transcriptional regulator n=1 Tax=Brevibacillus parabrevis TaxID=54914 RepID=A0A4Y3PJK6_BREPA|nr:MULTISPECIES: MurR/RpiR family transcriptional regulator [Brevibacillus]MBU8714322.1 MurR/RpiR family transcriptional regulator [Brevibacillus parabrevis]MDH6351460.1 DNA-binding MurR/RpiR family transcriptional regulator [Brevibacillus sp. 1238]RNB95768.1 MurR/RpiR family transcriptional regulator [Brevibacillus parabrevis]UED67539.1 MurR/RpiR family transcriptional regulator [Brevibacillus sp. HD3.3A]WDV93789.1 MurR/RpiR family transcriptional regulator [Brevibacillus parabrevis]
MENVQERIRKHYPELTNQQKLAAKYILAETKVVAQKPAKVVGALSGTSETTVIRLSYALGYSGYSELQQEIRSSLLDKVQKENAIDSLRAAAEDLRDQDDLISFNMEQDVAYIRQTLGGLKKEQLEQAVASIMAAKHILVVGFRSSYAPANWLAFSLNVVKGNAHLYRGPVDDANYLLTQINSDWLVITLSFPRYVSETILFTKAAKERGAVVLGITDDELSPVGPIADQVLKVHAPAPTALKGMTAIFSMLSVLVSGVVQADGEQVKERLLNYENTSRQIYPFVGETDM